MLKDIYGELILPSFKSFSEECTKLTQLIDSYANNPNDETLKTCRKQWIQVVLTWRHCDIFNVSKYQRSFIKSKIYTIFGEATFHSQKDKLLKAENLKAIGSIVKGINGLEYLLYSDKLELKDFAGYASLVSKELQGLAEQSYKIWLDSEADFIQKSDLSFGSSIQELVNEQVRYCEEFYFKKFSYPLGYLYQVDFSIVEHHESQIAILALKESVKVVERIFTDHFFGLLKHQSKNSKLPQEMSQQFSDIKAALTKFDKLPKFDQEVPADLERVFQELRKLLISIRVGVVNQLGVTVVLPNDGD